MLLCAMVIMSKNRRSPEVMAGTFLIICSIVMGAAFLTKVEYISFFSTLSDDFEYLADNTLILRLNSFLLVLSAVLMILFTSALLPAMKAHREVLAFTTAFFFIISTCLLCIAGMKGLSTIELLTYQQNKALSLIENEYVKANILSLAREKAIYLNISNAIAGLALITLGLFGVISKRIPFIPVFLSITAGIMMSIISLLLPGNILNEAGYILFLLALLLMGVRIAFKGFTRRRKREEINTSNE